MKNSLEDLNNHLFAQLERLGDEDLAGEDLAGEDLSKEIERAKAIGGMADRIIGNAQVVLEAEKLKAEYGGRSFDLPKMLGGKKDGQG